MNRGVIIVGAGGHARVVAEAITANGGHVLGFTDANPSHHGTLIDQYPVLGGDEVLGRYNQDEVMLVNGLGSTDIPVLRQALHKRLSAAGWRFGRVIHPRAIVSPAARIEDGAQVMAGAVVQAGAIIGSGSIVNTAAAIDHDCVIGACCHVAPGAVLSGGVVLGECCHVGTGAIIIQGVTLAANTLVAAGAVVVRDSAESSRLFGAPAKSKSRS